MHVLVARDGHLKFGIVTTVFELGVADESQNIKMPL